MITYSNVHCVCRVLVGVAVGRTISSNGQVRSCVVAYAGPTRRRDHLATVLPRPPSGHCPRRRHADILQTRLYVTQPRSIRAAPRLGAAESDNTESGRDPLQGVAMCRILCSVAPRACKGVLGAPELCR